MVWVHALSVVVVAMGCLGVLALALGENQPELAATAIPLSLASLYLCDRRQWIVLGTGVANLLAVVAMTVALWGFSRMRQDEQLFALAKLLVFLQCILLYRPKTLRLYWMLLMLSLLEFVVAGIVNTVPSFGFLMGSFLLLGGVSLCLFHLVEQVQRCRPGQLRIWPWSSLSVRHGPWPEEAFRWRLLPWGVWWHLGKLTAMTVIVAPVLFLAIPRRGQLSGGWFGPRQSFGPPITGFSTEVRLGELGEIISNPQEVMRVRLVSASTGRNYEMQEPPLFHGVTLWSYRRGYWTSQTARRLRLPILPPLRRPVHSDLVQVEITLEPLVNSTVVFAPRPVFNTQENTKPVFYDSRQDSLRRRPEDADRQFHCRLLTTAFHRGRMRRFIPVEPGLSRTHLAMLRQLPQGQGGLQRLRRIAQEVVAQVDPQDWIAQAEAMERYLRDSGLFQYTLRPPVRPVDMDPIEDFLTRQRSGHCEYFASALALMLRARGIPARVVVGFKGGEFNTVGNYYLVRQQDAHTWVNAFIPREKLPEGVRATLPPSAPGAWMVLDPTPGSQNLETTSALNPGNLIAHLRYLWFQYIVRFDAARQQQFVADLWKSAREWMQKRSGDQGNSAAEGSGNWLWAGLGILALAGVLLLVWGRKGWPGWVQSWPQGWGSAAAAVRFYRHLEQLGRRLLARSRRPSETPREFAAHMAQALALSAPHLASVPQEVVQAYYRVRFGHQELGAEQHRHLAQLLEQLEQALNGNASAGKASSDKASASTVPELAPPDAPNREAPPPHK